MSDTRVKLQKATAEALRESGIAGLSARTVAARAGVNQALVFYHFGTMPELVQAAVRPRWTTAWPTTANGSRRSIP